MSETLSYDPDGAGIKAAERVGLNQYCPCWRITTFSGAHETYCPIAQVAAVIDQVAAENETQLAETHAALEQSETEAATLRQAIETYLGDVTIDVALLKQALRETNAGARLLSELADLREQQHRTVDALVTSLMQRPGTGFFTGMRMLLQRWLLQRWEQK